MTKIIRGCGHLASGATALGLTLLLPLGCAEKVPPILGEFDGKAAIPVRVEKALRSPENLEPVSRERAPNKAGLPTVAGSICEVCPTSGCWVRLRGESAAGDRSGDESRGAILHVELLGFTAPRSLLGRKCFVQGRIVRDAEGNVKMLARGIATAD